MKGFREKCEKPPFLGISVQIGQFWTVFGQNWQNGNFFKKALGTFLLRLQALTNCKVSEKSNERFSSNRVTDERTHGRTHGWTDVNPKVSNDFVERPKIQTFCGTNLKKSVKNLIFERIKGLFQKYAWNIFAAYQSFILLRTWSYFRAHTWKNEIL